MLAGLAAVASAVAIAAGQQPAAAAPKPALLLAGLSAPTYVTGIASEPERLYVVEQPGTIRVVERGRLQPRPFLDLRGQITSGGEQGLLSVVFHPGYARNHRFFVFYTDANGDERVVEYRSRGAKAPARARLLFFQQDPYPNHNGGQLQFGPDGKLYLGEGDGGSAGDPQNNGQTFRTKLAKLWRIDVDRPAHPTQLVAYGLRNPWRFSFDRATGDLYIGDVGQNAWEEIDYVPRDRLSALHNFGWSVWEGDARYDTSRTLDPRAPYTPPIAVYPHSQGCSVTGGYVYRGGRAPALAGRYLYGDYCSGRVWSLKVVGGRATGIRLEPFRLPNLSSFGEDAAGALYAVTLDGKLYRLTPP